MHPDVAPLAGLVGTWRGTGRGEYPTIEPFEYDETVEFGEVGKPFLAYSQRTRAVLPDGSLGMPLHAESGYWRCPGDGRLEVVISHPFGLVEIEEGRVDTDGDGVLVDLRATTVAPSPTAKSVTAIERTFRLSGDSLTYSVRMAAVGLPLQHHLAADLSRATDGS